MKEHAMEYLKWVTTNCVARSTSRNNIWSNYWQLKITGVLYNNNEIYEYWEKINK